MSELEVIARTGQTPVTIETLANDFAAMGVRQGMVLLVHSSLSALGWVSGGPVAVILGLEQVLSERGTLVMPAHSGDFSDPAKWQHPPVPESWWETIRQTMPAYSAELTPTRGIGRIAETFRRQPGVLRSDHPQVSFAAWGAKAAAITRGHSLDFGLGEQSPLARIYELDGQVLLVGVGHENNTSLHLAEYRAALGERRIEENGAPIMSDGRRQWVAIRDLSLDDADFGSIGEQFARATGKVRSGLVGHAHAHLMPQRSLVDFAVRWMEQNRGASAD